MSNIIDDYDYNETSDISETEKDSNNQYIDDFGWI